MPEATEYFLLMGIQIQDYCCCERTIYADTWMLHACVQAKRKRANMGGLKLVVAGCVAAQEGETLLRRVPELDLVMGPHHANRCAPAPQDLT